MSRIARHGWLASDRGNVTCEIQATKKRLVQSQGESTKGWKAAVDDTHKRPHSESELMQNRSKRMSWLILVFAVTFGTYFGFKRTSRAAYESAEYTVVRVDGSYEIREYPELALASTDHRNQGDDDGSFMRLFRFISGKNEWEQQIAMTTPVFMQPRKGEARGRMDFVMPKQVAQQGVPKPTNGDVRVGKRPGGRFAVIRFSGRMSAETAAGMETKLREWIKGQGLTLKDEAEIAIYDPPWTPGPLRRNEVLIRLTDKPESRASN